MAFTHTGHIGQALVGLGQTIEGTLSFDGQPPNFFLLVMAENAIQVVSNTQREGLIELLRCHLAHLESNEIEMGALGDPQAH